MMDLDLFAGPGGWSEGRRLAGATLPMVGLEHDHNACVTAVRAGHWRVQADVATYPTAPFVGKVRGGIFSPPCPSFSTAGSGAGKDDVPNVLHLIADYASGRTPGEYKWHDERSALTAQPMRYITALKPRWIACEQVPPVLPIWKYMAERLRGMGYRTWCGILSAEEYGVPQTRKRAFLLASLDGPVGPPAPTHQAYKSGRESQVNDDLFGSPLPEPVSMADALGWGLDRRPSWTVSSGGADTGGAEVFANAANRKKLRQIVAMAPGGAASKMVDPRPAPAPAHTITGKGTAAWVLRNGTQDNACTRELDEPAGTLFFGGRGNAVDWVRGERPSTTVCGDVRIGSPGHKDRAGGEAQFSGESVRVTVQEAGVLQSFPADYPWSGTKTSQYQQVGNAVAVRLAAAVLAQFVSADSKRVAA
jgi:DNA (cytosine-5)-methyltransferase 1